MKLRPTLLAGMLLAVVLAPRVAHASKDYPQIVQSYWRMKGPIPAPGTKGCRLCHEDEVGGTGKATRPFGLTLKKKLSVVGASPSSLQKGLYAAYSQMTNSDGDPVSDYVEIVVDGTDPNDASKYVNPAPEPSGGGQGGESGYGEGGEGGQSSHGVKGPLPPLLPPSELPPAYTHGCAFEPAQRSPPAPQTVLWVGGLALLGYRVRRRR